MALATEAALRGDRILWGAPTYKQVGIAWEEFYKAVGGIAQLKKGDMDILFPTGGRIYCRSLELPDNARGYTADGVILDECGYVSEEAYYQVVRQMLMDTGGWLWGLGTPCGRNWFWREHQQAPDNPDCMAWQIPTVGCRIEGDKLVRVPHSLENPDVPFEEIQNIFQTAPVELFEQEVLAQFIQGGGSVFTNITANLYHGEDPDLHKGHLLILTVDWAKHRDWTVVSIGCADCKKELILERFNRIDYTFQRDRIKNLYDKYLPEIVLAERNAMGDPNIELLWEDGIPVTAWDMTPASKPGLIRRMATALQRAEWKFLDRKEATFELEAFEQRTSASGYTQYNAPSGAHDDTVIARALLVTAAATMGHVPMLVT